MEEMMIGQRADTRAGRADIASTNRRTTFILFWLFRRWRAAYRAERYWQTHLQGDIDVVFLVYGNFWQRLGLMLPQSWIMPLRPIIRVVCRILMEGDKQGVVVATRILRSRLKRDPQSVLRVYEALLAQFPQAKQFALAGQFPGWLHKALQTLRGVDVCDPRCSNGKQGTVFIAEATIRAALEQKNIELEQAAVVVAGGAGFVGTAIVERIAEIGCRVVAIDDRYPPNNVWEERILKTSLLAAVSIVDIAFVVTPQGNDGAAILRQLSRGSLALDDTHPPQTPELIRELEGRGIRVIKAVVRGAGVKIVPSLAKDHHEAGLPGCLVQALVGAVTGIATYPSQEAFNAAARSIGLEAWLLPFPT